MQRLSFVSYLLFLCLIPSIFANVNSTLLASNSAIGSKLTCNGTIAESGVSVAAIGDVNRDGIEDLAIGYQEINNEDGMVAIVYGTAKGIPSFDVCANKDPSKGYRIKGVKNSGSIFGASVKGIGDINKDGINDIFVSALWYNKGDGRAYVIYLPSPPTTADAIETYIWDTAPTKDQGLMIMASSTYKIIGLAINSAGDVNNDGIGDVILDVEIESYQEALFVLYGGINTGIVDLSILSPSQGFYMNATMYDNLWNISPCGDVNRDGYDDVIIGSYATKTVYVIYGHSKNTVRGSFSAPPTGTNGFSYKSSRQFLGTSVTCGDINADGIPDMISGSPGGTDASGSVYVIFGGQQDGVKDVDKMSATQGFKIGDATSGSGFGYSVNAAGDINGDGIVDLAIGATYEENQYGAVYIVYGNKAIKNITNIHNITADQGFVISGNGTNVKSMFGWDVNIGGDYNYDGVKDIVVGAPYDANKDGSTFIMYGVCAGSGYRMSNKVCCATPLQGTNGHCCPNNQVYLNNACGCASGYYISNAYCCPTGSTYDGTTCKVSNTIQSVSASPSKLGVGAIVGIAVGSTVFVVAIFVICLLWCKKRAADRLARRKALFKKPDISMVSASAFSIGTSIMVMGKH